MSTASEWPSVESRGSATSGDASAFCTTCGTAVQRDDRYCIDCGAPAHAPGMPAPPSHPRRPATPSNHDTTAHQARKEARELVVSLAVVALVTAAFIYARSGAAHTPDAAGPDVRTSIQRQQTRASIWRDYRYPADGFSIRLPASPRRQVVSVPARPAPYTVTTYELDAPTVPGAYRVMVTRLPEPIRANGVDIEYLRRLRDDGVRLAGGTHRRERAAVCGEHLGLECVIEMPINGTQHHQIFYVDPLVFQILVGGLSEDETADVFQGFHILGTAKR